MNPRRQVVVIGGKGVAIDLADQIIDASQSGPTDYEFLGFAFDDESFGRSIAGFPVVCKTRELLKTFPEPNTQFVFALYRPDIMTERVALFESYGLPLDRLFTFVHPGAFVSRTAKICPGAFVFSHTAVQSNCRVGSSCILNSHVLVGHDTEIGANCYLAPHVCLGSRIRIGKGVFLGLNCTVRELVEIGDYAFVGMASNVLKPVRPGAVVCGNPARERTS